MVIIQYYPLNKWDDPPSRESLPKNKQIKDTHNLLIVSRVAWPLPSSPVLLTPLHKVLEGQTQIGTSGLRLLIIPGLVSGWYPWWSQVPCRQGVANYLYLLSGTIPQVRDAKICIYPYAPMGPFCKCFWFWSGFNIFNGYLKNHSQKPGLTLNEVLVV